SVVEILRKWKWKTFRRLELHLCRLFPALGLSLAETFFENPDKLDEPSLQREGVLLLKEVFNQLQEPIRQNILQWVDKGPTEEFKERLRKHEGITEADVDSYVVRWRRDHFAILEGLLPEEYATKLSDLTQQSGPANR